MKRHGQVMLIAAMLTCVAFFAIVPGALGHPQTSTLDRIAKTGELRVAWTPWFPFQYRDPKTQQLSGFAVDFYEQMAKALGSNVKLVWAEHAMGLQPAGLQADKFDLMSLANRTPARLLVAEYVGPITRTGKGLMTTKAKVERFKGWQDADEPSVTICTGIGTATDVDMTRVFKKANLMRPDGNPPCILAVGAGRADMYADDIGNLIALTKEQPNFAVVPNGTFSKSEMGIFVKQGDQVFANWLNWFIRDMKLQGGVDQLLKKYKLEGIEVAW